MEKRKYIKENGTEKAIPVPFFVIMKDFRLFSVILKYA
jgi:hypothetical protein